jgi:hypothetical protein
MDGVQILDSARTAHEQKLAFHYQQAWMNIESDCNDSGSALST